MRACFFIRLETFALVELNDVQFILSIIFKKVGKALNPLANMILYLLSDFISNSYEVLFLRCQLHVLNKHPGELLGLVVRIADIPLNGFLHVFEL